MCCGRDRVSWLNEKFEGWLERNGPLCPSEAEACGRRRTRGSALLMLAGIVACLATFVPVDQKVEMSAKRLAGGVETVLARK